MSRRRKRHVPDDCVECFEVRAVLYLDAEGNELIDAVVSDPHRPEVQPAIHEVLGVLEEARLLLHDRHYAGQD